MTRTAWRPFLRGLLLLSALILLVQGASCVLRRPPEVKVGTTAPDWELPTLQGDTLRLSDLLGKPVVLNFWATWCFPCREEMPLLVQTAQAHPDAFTLVALNVGESPEQIRAFFDELGLTPPLVALDRQSAIATQYQIRGFPTTFFLDAEGVIRSIALGGVDETTLWRHLQAIGVSP